MADNKSKADLVYSYTLSKLKYLQSISESGAGKAALAQLRHGVGKRPGELPALWGSIFDKIPEELLGKKEASCAEWAVYTALTLYALHHQGNPDDVYQKDISVGRAAGELVKNDDDTERIVNRLNTIVTATSPNDLAYHLRGLIQLIKSSDIKLDHALLAKDLYLFNNNEIADSIKLRWGRDFYRKLNDRNNKKEGNDNG